MVHFVDSDEELMWTDDHRPPVPTTQWKRGTDGRVHADGVRAGVSRTSGMPQSSSVSTRARTRGRLAAGRAGFGAARLQGGIAAAARADRERVPHLQGRVAPDRGRRRRTPSSSGSGPRRRRRSSSGTRSATACSTFTPTTRAAFSTSRRTSTSLLNGQPVDRFTLAPKQEHIQRTTLTARSWARRDMAELRIQVDKTYVPALLPAATAAIRASSAFACSTRSWSPTDRR